MSEVVVDHAEGAVVPVHALLESETAAFLEGRAAFVKGFAALSEFKGKAGQLLVVPDTAGGMDRVLYGLGAIPDAAARIDHQLAPSRPVPAGVTVANGRYVANMCIGCHGADLAGGKIPGGPPDWPAASDMAAAAET